MAKAHFIAFDQVQ